MNETFYCRDTTEHNSSCSVDEIISQGGSYKSKDKKQIGEMKIANAVSPSLFMCINIMGIPFFIKSFTLEKQLTFFFKKLTQDILKIEVYIKEKLGVGRRLNFPATVHKMPVLLFL